jgi:hypothetical protein
MAERGSLNIEAYHEPGEIESARALKGRLSVETNAYNLPVGASRCPLRIGAGPRRKLGGRCWCSCRGIGS